MSVTTTWSITSIDTIKTQNGLTDIVYNVRWKLSGTSGSVTESEEGQCVHLPSPDSESFINYSSLSENVVIEWVKSILGTEKVASIENSVVSRVEEVFNSPSEENKPLPWS